MRTIFMTIALVMLMGVALVAGTTEKAMKGNDQATFDGTLVCLACDLKGNEGARAECKVFGHRHALKTKDGKYIAFLENKYSKDLINGEKCHNQKITVHGIYHANANMLDVETFEIGGKTKGWCDGCKSMDGCAMK